MLRNTETRFGTVTIVLHWTIAVLILGLVVVGFLMRRTEIDPALQFSLYQWHKSFGFTALGLAALRVFWWLVARSPTPPPTLGQVEQRAAGMTHLALIALTIIVPLTGWAVASASTLAIPSFYFNVVVIPHLPLEQSEASEAFWTYTHAIIAYGTLALVAVHAAAATHHHFVRRDEVLVRMLGLASSSRPTKAPKGAAAKTSLSKRNEP